MSNLRNKLDSSVFKKQFLSQFSKRPEVLTGVVLVAGILSYFILSPSDDTELEPVAIDTPTEQLASLPIPTIKNESTSVPVVESSQVPEKSKADDAENLQANASDTGDTGEGEKELVAEPHETFAETAPKEAHKSEAAPAKSVQQTDVIEKTVVASVEKKSPATTPTMPTKSENRKAVQSWVFAKNPQMYTIQLMGGANKKTIENFIKANSSQKNLSYFHTIKNDKSWYVAVQGSYNSFAEAEKQRVALPESLTKNGVWIRKYSSIQKEVSANAEKIILMSNSFATNN